MFSPGEDWGGSTFRTVITEDVMEKVAGRAAGGYVQEGQGDYF